MIGVAAKYLLQFGPLFLKAAFENGPYAKEHFYV